jgi:hypothetical protein
VGKKLFNNFQFTYRFVGVFYFVKFPSSSPISSPINADDTISIWESNGYNAFANVTDTIKTFLLTAMGKSSSMSCDLKLVTRFITSQNAEMPYCYLVSGLFLLSISEPSTVD